MSVPANQSQPTSVPPVVVLRFMAMIYFRCSVGAWRDVPPARLTGMSQYMYSGRDFPVQVPILLPLPPEHCTSGTLSECRVHLYYTEYL